MSTTLTISSLASKVVWDYESVLSWGNATNAASYSYSKSLANGTGASQADQIYVATGTLAGAATLTVNLSTLTDMFGNTLNMKRVKAIYLENTTDTTSTGLALGGDVTTPFVGPFNTGTDTITVRNGGNFFIAAPDATAYAVDTGINLLLTNSDGTNTATYKLVIVGCSA